MKRPYNSPDLQIDVFRFEDVCAATVSNLNAGQNGADDTITGGEGTGLDGDIGFS